MKLAQTCYIFHLFSKNQKNKNKNKNKNKTKKKQKKTKQNKTKQNKNKKKKKNCENYTFLRCFRPKPFQTYSQRVISKSHQLNKLVGLIMLIETYCDIGGGRLGVKRISYAKKSKCFFLNKIKVTRVTILGVSRFKG